MPLSSAAWIVPSGVRKLKDDANSAVPGLRYTSCIGRHMLRVDKMREARLLRNCHVLRGDEDSVRKRGIKCSENGLKGSRNSTRLTL